MGYTLEIITPSSRYSREADSLRAEDATGSFGIMKNHQEFMTLLSPCILIIKKGDKEEFAAVDGGVLRVEGGKVTVASREAAHGEDFLKLKDLLADQFSNKEEKEAAFMDLLANMEKLLMDKLVKIERD